MSSTNSWVIVLAGGEGKRIQPLIERCLGFACPKQYFTFCGEHSMLENTVDRAVRLAGAERVVTVIGAGHDRYLKNQRIQGRVMEQPSSRGTAAGIFLPAAHILAWDPEATLLILPSDHFLCPKDKALEQLNLIRRCAERLKDNLILAVAVPDAPETDYGWVKPGKNLPGCELEDPLPVREVLDFREKPCAEEADTCFRQGHLWNTMIVAVKLKTLWQLGLRLLPDLVGRFEAFQRMLSCGRPKRKRAQQRAIRDLYEIIPTFDFSQALLSRAAGQCVLMPLEGVIWSDWGRPERVFESLEKIGRRPSFLEAAKRWHRDHGRGGVRSPVLARLS